jgi:hypothetical protein
MGVKNRTMPVSFRGLGWLHLDGQGVEGLTEGVIREFGYSRPVGANNNLYRWLIRQGINASNGMNVIVSNGESSGINAKVTLRKSPTKTHPDYWRFHEYGFDGVPFLMAPIVLGGHQGSSSSVEARADAIRLLHRKISTRRRQFQGLVALGELGKTIKMVIRPARALRMAVGEFVDRAVKTVKRLPRRAPMRRILADAWLGDALGWGPTLADVKDGAVALARVVERDALERHQFHVLKQIETPVQSANLNVQVTCVRSPFVMNFNGEIKVVRKTTCVYYGAHLNRVADPPGLGNSARRLATLSGFNWVDLIPQAWELLPMSFLIDYFLNVGEVLEAAANIYDLPAYCTEVIIEETENIRNFSLDQKFMKDTWGDSLYAAESTGATVHSSYKTIARQQYPGNFEVPLSLKLPFQLGQWLNIAALLAGARSFQPFINR